MTTTSPADSRRHEGSTAKQVARRLLARVGVPVGAGILFTRRTRVMLALTVAGSILTAMLDMLGVAALVPLMQLLASKDRTGGAIGIFTRVLGPRYDDQELAVVIGAVMIAAFVLKATLTVLFRRWQLKFIAMENRRMSTRLLRAFLAAPYKLHLDRGTADLFRTVGEAPGNVYGNVVSGSVAMLSDGLALVGLLLVLVLVNPLAAMAALVYVGLSALSINRWIKRRSRAAGEDLLENQKRATQAMIHALGGIKETQLRGTGEFFVEEFDTAVGLRAKVLSTQAFLAELPKHMFETVFVVGVALMAIATFSTDSPTDALPTLAVFVAVGTRTIPGLVRILSAANAVRFGMPSVALLVRELHSLPDGSGPPARPVPSHRPRGIVALRDVHFRYDRSTDDVLRGINLEISPGSSLAIAGPSGGGKTTLVDILLGLLEPTRGQVLLGGEDIRTDLPGWQTTLGMVSQDVFWVSDTLAANIAFGVPPASHDPGLLAQAVDDAQLRTFVDALPDGLDTLLGDGGVRLSGGQLQRLGIARALYVQPQLIVLDEATSALDNITERRIADTMEALRGRTTLVIVAHRLSTVRNCDRLVFLEGGRVSAAGTFDEVRASNATFAELVELGNLDATPRIKDARLVPERPEQERA
jgi:ABC-type multidrug transport system fused ATPase/permease subunit